MRSWKGLDSATTRDPRVREALLAIDDFLHDVSAAMKSIGDGLSPVANNPPSIGTTDHGALSGLNDDDHVQYVALSPASFTRGAGQTITDSLTIVSNLSTTRPLTLTGGSNQATPVQLWQTSTGTATLDVRMETGGSQGAVLRTNTNSNLTLGRGGITNGIELLSAGTHIIGGKLGVIGTLSSTPSLFFVDAAAGTAVVADSDDNVRIIRRSATQTGMGLRLMDQTRAVTLASIGPTGEGVLTGTLGLNGSTSGTITISAGATPTNHTMTLPSNNASGALTNNGSGTLSWSAAVGTHALLDGGTVHSDTAADTVSRGSLIYGNSTPAWDELVIGSSNTVLRSDGTDASWGAIDHNYLSSRTRSRFIPAAEFSGTITTNGVSPDVMQRTSMSGSTDTNASLTFVVPVDYVSGFSYDLYYSSAGTSVNQVDWYASSLVLSNGNSVIAAASTSETFSSFPSGTADLLDIVGGNTGLAGDMSAGAVVRLVIQRTGSSDANNDSMNFHGILISYTADM